MVAGATVTTIGRHATFMTDPSLNRRVGISAVWTVMTRLMLQSMGIVSSIVIARLLGPEEVGVFEKAVIITGFLDMLTAMGLETALVGRRDRLQVHYDTAWTLNILRGLVTALAILALVPFADAWFQAPGVGAMLAVLALATLLRGFENIGMVDFRRDLEFDKEFRFLLYRRITMFVMALAIAFIWRTAWAMVMATLAAAVVGLVMSFLMSPMRPRLTLAAWRDLFHFVKWMFAYETIQAFSSKLEGLILLKMATPTEVAFYNRANEIGGTPSTEIAMPIVRAVLPGMMKTGDDQLRRNEMFISFMALALTVALPAGLGLVLVADSLVTVLLGLAWLPMAPLLEILALRGILRVINANSGSAFIAAGRVDLLTKTTTFGIVTRLPMIILGYMYGGLNGLAWASVFAATISIGGTCYALNYIGVPVVRPLFARLWRVMLGCVGMIAAVRLLQASPDWARLDDLTHLLGESVIGAAVFTLVTLAAWVLGGRPSGPDATLVSVIAARLRRRRA